MSSLQTLIIALCLPFLVAATHADEIGGKTYEQWKADLTNSDPRVRAAAISVISQLGVKAEDAVPLLVERTRDKDDNTRSKAVIALQIVAIRGTDRSRVVQALGYCVSHDAHAIIRYEAARVLRHFGPDVRDVSEDLAQGIGESSNLAVRQACLAALIAAGEDAKNGPKARVTDALVILCATAPKYPAPTRLQAVIALGALGPPRDPKKLAQVLAALEEYAHGNNKLLRIWSSASSMILRNRANKTDLAMIANYLKDRGWSVRVQAVKALGALQEKAKPYVPDIVRLLENEMESSVIAAAGDALGRIGDRSESVLKALIKLTQREDAQSTAIVLSACAALAQLGVGSADVMAALNKVLDHKDLGEGHKNSVRKLIEEIRKPKRDNEAKPKPRADPLKKPAPR